MRGVIMGAMVPAQAASEQGVAKCPVGLTERNTRMPDSAGITLITTAWLGLARRQGLALS